MSDALTHELELLKAKFELEKVHGRQQEPEVAGPSQNRGVEERSKRDLIGGSSATGGSAKGSHDRALQIMTQKAELYKKFKRNEADISDSVMLRNDDSDWSQESEDEDDIEDDSEVEVVDEFGRTRVVPRSKRHLFEHKGPEQGSVPDDPDYNPYARVAKPVGVIYGHTIQTEAFDATQAERAARARQVLEAEQEALKPQFYDSNLEVRQRGVGFMQFSLDPEKRLQQQQDLREARAVTEAAVKAKQQEHQHEELYDKFAKRLQQRKERLEAVQ